MSLIDQIPLTGLHKDVYKDVMDYMENIKTRRANTLAKENTLAQDQKQFEATKEFEREKMNLTNQLEHEKLSELKNYHHGRLALQNNEANGGKKLSAQERSEAMKLIQQVQAGRSLINKSRKMEEMLVANKNLTGKLPWLMNKAGMGGEDLGTFNTRAGDVQAGIAKLGSKMGGARALQWAEKMKASDWKDTPSNLGHVRGLIEDTESDVQDAVALYEAMTGHPYPLKMDDEKSAAGTANGNVNVTKNHVTEKNILHTMQETGYSREEVMKRLKAKGLI